MNAKGIAFLVAIVQLLAFGSIAQQSDTISARINFLIKDNESKFNALLWPLHKMSGAPSPFYTYLWEFGDGQFSFEKEPRHIYGDTGTYNVRLYATNNYDDGKPPPTRPRPLKVRSKTLYAANNVPPFFKSDGSIEMKVNRMPKPDEDMILIMGYRNQSKAKTCNGSLVLFYNKKEFKQPNFNLTEERAYYDEIKSSLDTMMAYLPNAEIMESTASAIGSGPRIEESSTLRRIKFADLLAYKQQVFRKSNVWRFQNLEKGSEKFFFLTLHTTPEMIKDTNAVITVTGMFVPDDPNIEIEQYELELQIVASHDPNRMMLKNRRLNYRFTGTKKELEYTVLFQNTGKGPARNISIGIAIPPMFDPQSIEFLDIQPKCVTDSFSADTVCLSKIVGKDSIQLIFSNIYLQGILEEGMKDPDLTKGFLKYRIHFNNHLKKLPFDSRAAIVFDRQETVYSNPSQGNFKPGHSPALIAGYGMHFGDLGKNEATDNNFNLGAGLSPYSPYRKFLQAELYIGFQGYPDRFVNQTQSIDTFVNGRMYSGFGALYQKYSVITLDIVPLHLRYNLNDFLGVGAGTVITLDAMSLISPRKVYYLYDSSGTGPTLLQKKESGYTKWFKKSDFAVFADMQIGQVRAGPAIGFRFLHYFRHPQNRLFIYAIWRL